MSSIILLGAAHVHLDNHLATAREHGVSISHVFDRDEARAVGVAQLPTRTVKELPAVLEPDVFRSLQLLPGVKAASDYSSGLYIRGGSPDQTLILLDRTTVLVTSNLGNGSNHSNKNMPALLIGGRYDHGRHIAVEPGSTPMGNLFVTILNQMGIADREFHTGTGPLKGLEVG